MLHLSTFVKRSCGFYFPHISRHFALLSNSDRRLRLRQSYLKRKEHESQETTSNKQVFV